MTSDYADIMPDPFFDPPLKGCPIEDQGAAVRSNQPRTRERTVVGLIGLVR